MILDKEKTLVQSSFLTRKKEGKKFKLTHMISGRQFVVDEKTIEVLDYFSDPQLVKSEELSEGMKSSLSVMLSSGMLIDVESETKETFDSNLKNDSLFGFKQYEDTEKENKVVFLGVPYGGGNNYSDETGKFPYLFREYLTKHGLLLKPNAEPNYHFLGNNAEVYNLDDLIKNEKVRDAGDVFIHHYESRYDIYKKIEFLFGKLVRNNKVPFAIGGDHSISYPIISSMTTRYPNFNVLHFDAHTDIYCNQFQGILDNNGLHHHGNFVTKCLELENLNTYYQFGIRGINNAFHKNTDPKLKVFWSDQIKDVLKHDKPLEIPDDEYYYITFDIDVLDPCIAPGTATPLPGGFSFEEMLQLFKKIGLENKKIIGVDFVEVNKEKDPNGLTMSLSAQIILNLLNYIKL